MASRGDFGIGFWAGIGVLSLLDLIARGLSHTLYVYDWYILGVAVLAIIISSLIKVGN